MRKPDPDFPTSHGRSEGPAKAVAVALASRLAGVTNRAVGEHYGIGSSAVNSIHVRLSDRPEVLAAVDLIARQLTKRKTKA